MTTSTSLWQASVHKHLFSERMNRHDILIHLHIHGNMQFSDELHHVFPGIAAFSFLF